MKLLHCLTMNSCLASLPINLSCWFINYYWDCLHCYFLLNKDYSMLSKHHIFLVDNKINTSLWNPIFIYQVNKQQWGRYKKQYFTLQVSDIYGFYGKMTSLAFKIVWSCNIDCWDWSWPNGLYPYRSSKNITPTLQTSTYKS